MATYNCAEYIAETIDSIIVQTYSDWELIIIDDASTDKTKSIIDKYNDKRIKYLKNSENKGLAASLNIGIQVASGVYICRMDSDDVMHNDRLEKQVEFLNKNDDIAIVGSNLHLFGDGYKDSFTKYPQTSPKLFAYLPFFSPLPHPSWMIRKSAFSKEELKYDESFRTSQDYEFLFRAFKGGKKIYCIKEPLVNYRMTNNSISNKGKKGDANTFRVQKKIAKLLCISASEKTLYSINFLKAGESHDLISFAKCIYVYWVIWFNNMIHGVFDRSMLSELTFKNFILAFKLFAKCLIKRI